MLETKDDLLVQQDRQIQDLRRDKVRMVALIAELKAKVKKLKTENRKLHERTEKRVSAVDDATRAIIGWYPPPRN